MGPRTELVPTVQVQAEEDGFEEEREPLKRERHSDNGPRELHERRPQETEFEREHGAGHSADREENGRSSCPPLGQVQVFRTTGTQPCDLGGDHHDRHGHADHRKNDVKGERHAHLPPRVEKVHAAHDLLIVARVWTADAVNA